MSAGAVYRRRTSLSSLPAVSAYSSPGFLLSFEGSEGCGKSTQIRLLKERLENAGRKVEVLREPGGTEIGESIRHLLQHAKEGHSMTPETELLLFAASRAQIVREKIRPLVESGVFVILDRFLDSTTVYQGHARGLPLDAVNAINRFAIGGTLPQLTLLLDLDVQTAWQRIHATGRELDRMESQPPEFFEKVRQGYLSLAKAEPERIQIIDANATPEVVHEAVWKQVAARLA
ncbi:MAG: dTMP kinase [Prosthecobacter sp.]|uniref:dTMP kinase n=1 Tax=Prosthecobacter sp. TaxID=1965333 RepID=UPI0019F84805|nr:dTMP kinase [Prosthecobacter sp.]MBE2286351.1 dTMP kinase [Prosthecobacter sp.]